MLKLIDIPLVDIRGQTPVELVRLYPDKARALVSAATNTLGFVSRAASTLALPLGDRASKAWLARSANPYLNEIDAVEDQLQLRGTHTLNICFEWGCTSGIRAKNGIPEMYRVLDWDFPQLGENLVVALQSGEAGDFYNITWPGLVGSFQAFAPGRFSAAINQAPMRRHRAGYLGDWFNNRIAVKKRIGLPPAHLLRRVFETAADYDAAKKILSHTEIAVPAIFILCGTKSNEGCIIERTEDDFAVRPLNANGVCAANHFESRLNASGHSYRPRPIDSAGRAQCAAALVDGDFEGDFGWFKAPIANAHSRLAFHASAAAGTLALMGVSGPRPVTRTFTIGTAN